MLQANRNRMVVETSQIIQCMRKWFGLQHPKILINITSRLADSDFIISTIYRHVLVCIGSISLIMLVRVLSKFDNRIWWWWKL